MDTLKVYIQPVSEGYEHPENVNAAKELLAVELPPSGVEIVTEEQKGNAHLIVDFKKTLSEEDIDDTSLRTRQLHLTIVTSSVPKAPATAAIVQRYNEKHHQRTRVAVDGSRLKPNTLKTAIQKLVKNTLTTYQLHDTMMAQISAMQQNNINTPEKFIANVTGLEALYPQKYAETNTALTFSREVIERYGPIQNSDRKGSWIHVCRFGEDVNAETSPTIVICDDPATQRDARELSISAPYKQLKMLVVVYATTLSTITDILQDGIDLLNHRTALLPWAWSQTPQPLSTVMTLRAKAQATIDQCLAVLEVGASEVFNNSIRNSQ